MKEDVQNNILGELFIVNKDINIDDYVVNNKGRFFRGYRDDMIINLEEHTLEFSRDGLMRILPEYMFFDEQFLRQYKVDEDLEKRNGELKSQKEQLSVFFDAFDTIFERRNIELHRVIDHIESNRVEFILKELYDIDIHRIRNVHVRKLARLLLDGDKVKGNLQMIPFFVRSILGVNISCRSVARVVDEKNSFYHTELQFFIFIEGLTSKEYRQKMEEYDEFFWYLEQWFLPFDCDLDFCIKDFHQNFVLGQEMTLDYNIRF